MNSYECKPKCRIVPGHEDLVAQRMRLHAERQDQSALRAEWQGYCRALANDEWGDASPSRMMVELWRELSGDAFRKRDADFTDQIDVDIERDSAAADENSSRSSLSESTGSGLLMNSEYKVQP